MLVKEATGLDCSKWEWLTFWQTYHFHHITCFRQSGTCKQREANSPLFCLNHCLWYSCDFRNTLIGDKYSLLMHRIKIKSHANFLWNEQNVFVGGFISFQSAVTLVVLQWQKAYRILAALPFKMSASRSHGAWRPHHEQWAYTSNFVQYITGFQMNINDEIRPQYITLYDRWAIGSCA